MTQPSSRTPRHGSLPLAALPLLAALAALASSATPSAGLAQPRPRQVEQTLSVQDYEPRSTLKVPAIVCQI